MPQEELGYVELEWTCKRCGTRNPGLNKVCSNCGAPMEEGQKFEAPAEQKIITEEKKLGAAEKAPDIVCAYCGTRNPADAKSCSNCGADLSQGKARQAGEVIGAMDTGPVPDVKCLVCGTMNPASNLKCSKCGAPLAKAQAPAPQPAKAAAPPGGIGIGLFVVAALVLICIVGGLLLLGGSRTTDTQGVVESIGWERTIQIVAPVPVAYQDWRDEIPSNAQVGQCQDRVRSTSDQPVPNSEKVCGTPYLVDQGTGAAKAVQDCVYRVYDSYCEYEVLQLRPVDTIVASGEGFNAQWPTASLAAGQQFGQRIERYRIVFEEDDKLFTYVTNNPQQFAQFKPGTRWKLKVNDSGTVVAVEGQE
jgi:ribosomal protein L37E